MEAKPKSSAIPETPIAKLRDFVFRRPCRPRTRCGADFVIVKKNCFFAGRRGEREKTSRRRKGEGSSVRFHGGIHPDYHKGATSGKKVEPLPPPELLYVPVSQHIGAPAEPLVAPGDKVALGQLIAKSEAQLTARIHAPRSRPTRTPRGGGCRRSSSRTTGSTP